jgi:peptidoglycan/xylan/chitin deacetylase (PgdA/CDA1 family)
VAVFVVTESVKRRLHGSIDEETVKTVAALENVTVASHSRTHPLLSRLSDAQVDEEVRGSKQDLEAMLGRPVDFFAYPSGDIDERVVRITGESGYKLAFTTSQKRLKGIPAGLHSLTRVKITRSADNPLVFWVKLSGIYQLFKEQRERLKPPA